SGKIVGEPTSRSMACCTPCAGTNSNMGNSEAERRAMLTPPKAELLERWRRGASLGATASIPRRLGAEPAPLSLAQQRVWFMEALHPGTPSWNMFFCARVLGELDPDVLRMSLRDLVGRHDTLRTRMAVERGVACQVVDATVQPELEIIDIRGADGD